MLRTPEADAFPKYPASWYLFSRSGQVRQKPMSQTILGRRLLAFRGADGQAAVMDAVCSHLGADLGKGRVQGGVVQCPFHHWEYGADGVCVRIPAAESIPAAARQVTYPVVERHGLIFFFNGPVAAFPLPFFDDCRAEDLIAARPFGVDLDCPWYLIGANGFDLQHFKAAHDRVLVGEPTVESLSPLARRASGRFNIVGRSPLDRLTRWFAGAEVEMSSTDWCGTLMFTTATFRRTRSYGMVTVCPLGDESVRVQVTVFVRRAANRLGRVLLDPLRVRLRRFFILKFLVRDVGLLSGLRYQPHGLIDCDRHLADYWHWLASLDGN